MGSGVQGQMHSKNNLSLVNANKPPLVFSDKLIDRTERFNALNSQIKINKHKNSKSYQVKNDQNAKDNLSMKKILENG